MQQAESLPSTLLLQTKRVWEMPQMPPAAALRQSSLQGCLQGKDALLHWLTPQPASQARTLALYAVLATNLAAPTRSYRAGPASPGVGFINQGPSVRSMQASHQRQHSHTQEMRAAPPQVRGKCSNLHDCSIGAAMRKIRKKACPCRSTSTARRHPPIQRKDSLAAMTSPMKP